MCGQKLRCGSQVELALCMRTLAHLDGGLPLSSTAKLDGVLEQAEPRPMEIAWPKEMLCHKVGLNC